MSEARPESALVRGRRAVAFTLVELLVVVAIIALLISMLMPSLKKAREQTRSVHCGATLKGLVSGLQIYFAENDEWIPGRNTTGLEIWSAFLAETDTVPDAMQRSRVPVQTYDWMTPILRVTTQLPTDRARRFRVLLDDYRCASVSFKAVLYSPSSQIVDNDRFVAELQRDGAFTGVSYLMPSYFQLWGSEDADGAVVGSTRWRTNTLNFMAKAPATFFNVEMTRYRSRANRVGTPADKIAIADGTRYLPEHPGPLDFDHHYDPERRKLVDLQWYGTFTSSGAWWRGSTAYGDRSPSEGRNLRLSYRHNDGIEAAFFDGHVERISQKLSRKIDWWYPRGARVRRNSDGSSDYQTYPINYVIR